MEFGVGWRACLLPIPFLGLSCFPAGQSLYIEKYGFWVWRRRLLYRKNYNLFFTVTRVGRDGEVFYSLWSLVNHSGTCSEIHHGSQEACSLCLLSLKKMASSLVACCATCNRTTSCSKVLIPSTIEDSIKRCSFCDKYMQRLPCKP
jgi:hypothetical protein